MNWRFLASARQRGTLLPLFLALSMGECLAASDGLSELDFLQEFPVVLSASRLSQPLSEAPNAVTVIDRAMIQASGFRTIADLFKMVPGMYVDYKEGYTPVVSYRGATDEYTRRMQVLVDGRSVYLPPYNTVDWEDLPLHIDDIERIEVVRGPAATSYGSNSIMGVISITTRDASALNGASISVTQGTGGGGGGVSDAVAHFGKSGGDFDYRLTFGKRADNGFNFPANSPKFYNGYNDSSATHIVSLRSNYHPNGTDSFDVQLGFSDGVRASGDPRIDPTAVLPNTSPPHDIKNRSGYQQLAWLHTLGQDDDVQLHYYHISRNSVDERFSLPYAGVSYWINDNISARRDEFELQHTTRLGAANRLVWGLATRHESVEAPSLLLTSQSLQQSRLFAHDEWRVSPMLLLNAGAMLEDDGMGHRNLSPRAVFNFHATPEHTFRAGVSVAYRNPAIFEEKGNSRHLTNQFEQFMLASGGLRPERALSREIGYVGEFRNGLMVDVRAYNDQVSDIILEDPFLVPGSVRNPSYDFRNEFLARYTGFEGTVKYNWGERKNSLIFNYAHQSVSAALVGVPKILTQTPLVPPLSPAEWAFFQNYILTQLQGAERDFSITAPTNSFSILYSRQMGNGYSASFGYYQQGVVQVLIGQVPQPLTRRLDMRVAKRIEPVQAGGLKISGGEVALVLQNVFQDSNVGYASNLFDRRAYLTATVNF